MAGYQLKITLKGAHPPVWRRMVVPEKITFFDLHRVIQAAFGWQNDQDYVFEIGSAPDTAIIDPESLDFYAAMVPDADLFDVKRTLLDDWILPAGQILYMYGFQVSWMHQIKLEKQVEDFAERNAVLLKAAGDGFEEGGEGVDDNEAPPVIQKDGVEVETDPDADDTRLHRLALDPETINRSLEEMTFPRRRRSSRSEILPDDDDFWNDLYESDEPDSPDDFDDSVEDEKVQRSIALLAQAFDTEILMEFLSFLLERHPEEYHRVMAEIDCMVSDFPSESEEKSEESEDTKMNLSEPIRFSEKLKEKKEKK